MHASLFSSITKDLAVAGACRLPGWGPRDSPNQWIKKDNNGELVVIL